MLTDSALTRPRSLAFAANIVSIALLAVTWATESAPIAICAIFAFEAAAASNIVVAGKAWWSYALAFAGAAVICISSLVTGGATLICLALLALYHSVHVRIAISSNSQSKAIAL